MCVCACVSVRHSSRVAVCVAVDNRISSTTKQRIAFLLPLSASALLLSAQCRLAFAKGCCSSRLGEHSLLLDWSDTDCISAVASYCSGRLVLGVLIERAAREESEGESSDE